MRPAELALAFADRLQVGEELARVVLVGQRVDDRHPATRRPWPRSASCPDVRQTIAAHCRSSTRAVSSIGSPRPSWVAARR